MQKHCFIYAHTTLKCKHPPCWTDEEIRQIRERGCYEAHAQSLHIARFRLDESSGKMTGFVLLCIIKDNSRILYFYNNDCNDPLCVNEDIRTQIDKQFESLIFYWTVPPVCQRQVNWFVIVTI